MTDAEKIRRLEAQVVALKARIKAPHNYVLVPSAPASPEPDFDYCADAATEATGLPNLARNPWMNIFIREIRRWAAHQAFEQATKSNWRLMSEAPHGYEGDIVLKTRDGEHRVGHTNWLNHDDSVAGRYVCWMPLPLQDPPSETIYPVMKEQLLAACYAYKPTYGRDSLEERNSHETRMRDAIEAAVGGLEHRALLAVSAAVEALYFDDGHKVKGALQEVVDRLFPKLGELMRTEPEKAYRLFNPERESSSNDSPATA